MKKTKMFIIMSTCFLSIAPSIGVCYAEEQTTTVSYTPDYIELEPTDIKIVIEAEMNEFGSIYDENHELGVGINVFHLRDTERKTLRIKVKSGYDVKQVLYDKDDITKNLRQARNRSLEKEYLIDIIGKGRDAKLEITFKEMDPIKPNEPEVPKEPDKPGQAEKPEIPSEPSYPKDPSGTSKPSLPNTGDETTAYLYFMTIGIAGIVIITLLYKESEEKR